MEDRFKYPAIVIPAYQPDRQLLVLVQKLRGKRPAQQIIVVDDGSDADRQPIFAALNDLQVDVLHHPVNQGKGQALKTVFTYYLNAMGEKALGVVTVDADGQHDVEDSLAISDALAQAPDCLHLGVRDFNCKKIPWRSKAGNQFTTAFFRLISGISLQDTQTGLRGVPAPLMKLLLNSPADGYELEMEMLLLAVQKKIKINPMPIQTIYINSNLASHFNPWRDSFKIYKVAFLFLFSLLKKREE